MRCDYEFVTVWRAPGTVAEVRNVLSDGRELPRWWPSVYLDVVLRERGDADQVGSVTDLHTTGWLPYTLRWSLTLTEPVTDTGFALSADGDLNGTGRWTFVQDGPETRTSTSRSFPAPVTRSPTPWMPFTLICASRPKLTTARPLSRFSHASATSIFEGSASLHAMYVRPWPRM